MRTVRLPLVDTSFLLRADGVSVGEEHWFPSQRPRIQISDGACTVSESTMAMDTGFSGLSSRVRFPPRPLRHGDRVVERGGLQILLGLAHTSVRIRPMASNSVDVVIQSSVAANALPR